MIAADGWDEGWLFGSDDSNKKKEAYRDNKQYITGDLYKLLRVSSMGVFGTEIQAHQDMVQDTCPRQLLADYQ